jgi:hypothetical protein
MRKIAGAISAIALVSAAVLTCSKTLLVTQAVGMGVADQGIGGESSAAKVAQRFPTGTELFVAFVSPREADHAAAVIRDMKADRLPATAAACARPFSPVPTTDCLATSSKAVAAASRPAAAERPTAPAAPIAAAAASPPAVAAVPAVVERRATPAPPETARQPVAAAPSSCAHTLPTANARVERVLARIKDARARQGSDACAGYRSDFFEIAQAREVTALCKRGPERDRELSRIDGAVEDINGAIARSCGT